MAKKLPIGHQVIENPKEKGKKSLAKTHRDTIPFKRTTKKK